jgi:hypothetical protein
MTSRVPSSFALRFPSRAVREWAGRYSYRGVRYIEREVGPAVRKAGYYTRQQFLDTCRWKTGRTQSRCRKNEETFIKAVTRVALSHPNERVRIEVLTLLDGVDWPTASVLLHFGHREPYPILDFRALWSVGIRRPPRYSFNFWWQYVEFCRRLSQGCGVSMRDFDRALWQYSKERQRVIP